MQEAEIYQIGNPWQKKIYRHMSAYLETKKVIRFGETSKGNYYKHWLCAEDSELNFITPAIHAATKERFVRHKAGDLNRVLTNTAASQSYCFNLIIYLQQNPSLADRLFSSLLEKNVQVRHLEPEFTPNKCDSIKGFERVGDESIGDQSGNQGTDSDIAVFYTYDEGKKGLLLIEFKFIEAEFSTCSSYRSKENITQVCNSFSFYPDLIEQKEKADGRHLCGYNKYFNWDLTKTSKVLDIQKIKTSAACPFRFGLNQLWRNMLLAEKVAAARNCDEFGFWVFSPKENDEYLWRKTETEKQFCKILTERGNKHFKKVYLETILDELEKIITLEEDQRWIMGMILKYRVA